MASWCLGGEKGSCQGSFTSCSSGLDPLQPLGHRAGQRGAQDEDGSGTVTLVSTALPEEGSFTWEETQMYLLAGTDLSSSQTSGKS
ncbi:hypothetical protein NHX12_031283 [Muraenolepis orangiensis]|uniref:Uncharacterized protein n=1 Tax=Muraenolepis orangiensis TaxID=630683 RepID=A0A9Q0IJG3_9TELE|nr:hypothetical protein NHX12_031283 [Muraenolepis orangiensis]